MISRFSNFINRKELLSLFRVDKRNSVARYEKAFAKKANAKYAVAFGYGRTALLLGLKSLKIRGKFIICPAYTCVVVAHAIKYSGNTPLFIDCAPDSYNMDVKKIDSAMNEFSKEVGAIVFTSIFGEPVDLDYVKEFKRKYPNVRIIQDCAHSFFASWKGEEVQNHGDFAIYGLNVSKIIHSIFGGMLTTNDHKIQKELVSIRDSHLRPVGGLKSIKRIFYYISIYIAFSRPVYGFVNWLDRRGFLGGFTKYYDDNKVEMPSDYLDEMDEVSARVGNEQLKKYDSIINARRASAKIYNDELKGICGFELPSASSHGHTYSHYVVRVNDRNKVLRDFIDNGIQLGWLIEYTVPLMKIYKNGHTEKQFKFSLRNSETCINLPIYSEQVARKVSTEVKKYLWTT